MIKERWTGLLCVHDEVLNLLLILYSFNFFPLVEKLTVHNFTHSVNNFSHSSMCAAKELGFEVVNPATDDILKITAQKTNGNGFDRVFDCAGAQAVANSLLDVVKVRGKIVIVASNGVSPSNT